MSDREYQMQRNLCRWIDVHYPWAYYRSDLGGIRLNMGQAVKAKNIQKYRGHPDFVIFEQSNGFPALFLELKDKETDVFLKRGGLPKANAIHLIEQVAMILMLRKKGYAADLVIGVEQAQVMASNYLYWPEVFKPQEHYTDNIKRILSEATDEQVRQAQLDHPVVFDYVKIGDAQ